MGKQDDVLMDGRKALFDTLSDVMAGMLGLTGSGTGFQPMTHFPDEESGTIWFITPNDTELVTSLGMGEDADYVVISTDHDVHISMRGKLYHLHDEAKLDELWSPLVAAWYEGGRDDPRIALLRFDPEVAEIWASTDSALKFGFEILRANLSAAHTPDVGVKATVRFPIAA